MNMKWLIYINGIVLASLLAYLIKLSFLSNNGGFFWRAIALTVTFTVIISLILYRLISIDMPSIVFISGALNVFMFLFVVSATIPIDGIWCLSYGHPLINPNSCGGGINYHSLWAGVFGIHSSYKAGEGGLCMLHYNYDNSTNLCRRDQLGFYENVDKQGRVHFDTQTLILNLGWIIFPLGALAAYIGYLKRD